MSSDRNEMDIKDYLDSKIDTVNTRIDALGDRMDDVCQRQVETDQKVDKLTEWVNRTDGAFKVIIGLLMIIAGILGLQVVLQVQVGIA